jgi:hypothetical protein
MALLKRRPRVVLVPAIAISALGIIYWSLPASIDDVEMPPLPEESRAAYETYRLAFLPDGYPGRRTENGIVPHPIYGAYVIGDYIALHERTKEVEYLQAARKVADAAISRMDDLQGALVFYYRPEMELTSLPGTFYSGLTQARYLRAFTLLWRATGDEKYRVASERVFEGLTIPVERGGVARAFRGDLVIEEYPNAAIGDYTLNGWLTALLVVKDYATETGSAPADALFERSARALKVLLPLYDLPQLAASRYRLTGQTSARLRFNGTAARLVGGLVEMPGEGSLAFERGWANQWRNFVTEESSEEVMLLAVFNYSTFPMENVLRFDIDAEQAGTVEIDLLAGDDNPITHVPDNLHWVRLAELKLRKGPNRLATGVPWQHASFVAGAASFSEVDGSLQNRYHTMHVTLLRQLAEKTGEPVFEEYARGWEGYVGLWPSMPIDREAGVSSILDR